MPERCRKPNLVDAMIVIAALAVGFGLGRAVIVESWRGRPRLPQFRLFWVTQSIHDGALACVWMLTLAFLVIRLRRPRPRLLDLLRQPGTVACLVALLMTALLVVNVAASTDRPRLSTWFQWLSIVGANGVVLGWAMLGIARAWTPERSWIDRTGLVLGFCWLGLFGLLELSFRL
jgi:hypothetical protein